ncbi:MAG TPA: 2-succinyl-5-enolpyruvyl-6-hydroxy-3-cyclohexene-1-carboxylic-acid synthase [Acidimicrobiales bacterium]|nr:2-succinyl-5-enolpyruvyl-6-hydroxy-3-cyclohexene-1-carboxylic-acid synthase [Acidimicrobiales bacterium]
MPRSVPSPSVAQATFAATLFDEWIEAGLRDVVISPGSRSTPLVLAAAQRDELTLHVRLDERSAGFFALGRSLATKMPVVIIVTSGTAATELHACVAEADLAFVPLVVVTADRPPELHGVGAPQTIEQGRLYGAMVRLFEDPGVADLEHASSWRPLASRLWHAARGDDASPGPVHLNAAFVEPLVATPLELPESTVASRSKVRASDPLDAAAFDVSGQSVLCVVGRGVSRDVIGECRELDWVVLGDATAQGSLPYFDALLRSVDFSERARPDVVVRLGGIPASKVLGERLLEWNVRTVGLSGAGFIADPDHLISETYAGLPRRDDPRHVADSDYALLWRGASNEVATWLERVEREESEFNEPVVARTVVEASTVSDVALVVGSSMPVRDVEWWAPPRRSATYANRGANGIDGVVSTVLGVAAGSKAIGLVGDLTMLHDVSGLVEGLGAVGGSCVLVVVDNGGGGIFSFLPQATILENERFELLFATPRVYDLEVVANAFGHAATTVTTAEELRTAIEKGVASEGLSVVVAKVPSRAENVTLHQKWNDHVNDLVNRSNG